MNSWKSFFITYFILTLAPVYGQVEQIQKLLNLTDSGRYFEARDLYRDIHQTMDSDLELHYQYRKHSFMNQEDSTVYCLEKMLEDYPEFFAHISINLYAELLDRYAHLRDFPRALNTYGRMKQHLADNPYNINEEELTLWKNSLEERMKNLQEAMNTPPIILKRKAKNIPVKIEGTERLFFEAKFNGISQKALFDTGFEVYCIMSRKYAEATGLKCDTSKVVENPVNQTDMQLNIINADSIEIGNITLYNLPIAIFDYDTALLLPDSIKNDSAKIEQFNVVKDELMKPTFGLSTMKLIGKFLIDYKNNRISFPNSNICTKASKEPNLFCYNNKLYTHLKLNGKELTGQLDTGSDGYLAIDSIFHTQYQNEIPLDNITVKEPYNMAMIHRTWIDIPYDMPYKPTITFNEKPMPLSKEEPIRIYSLRPIWPTEFFDGVAGYYFFKNIGRRLLLDLNTMRLDAI